MPNAFSIAIPPYTVEVNTMNVQRPVLLQVYVTSGEVKRKRYHMKADGNGQLTFALSNDVPPKLLACEPELSSLILENFRS